MKKSTRLKGYLFGILATGFLIFPSAAEAAEKNTEDFSKAIIAILEVAAIMALIFVTLLLLNRFKGKLTDKDAPEFMEKIELPERKSFFSHKSKAVKKDVETEATDANNESKDKNANSESKDKEQ